MRNRGLEIVLLEQTPLHEPTLTSFSSFSARNTLYGERNDSTIINITTYPIGTAVNSKTEQGHDSRTYKTDILANLFKSLGRYITIAQGGHLMANDCLVKKYQLTNKYCSFKFFQ